MPEAPLDRFLIRTHLGYPDAHHGVAMLDSQQTQHPIETLTPTADPELLQALQRAVREILTDPMLKQYIVQIVAATRSHDAVYLGASPRGSLELLQCAQANTLLNGRDFTYPG